MIDIITLVTNNEVYTTNVISAFAHVDDVNLFPIYNPESATKGLNEGIDSGISDIIVMIHQDVICPPSWVRCLKAQIEKVEKVSPDWGVLGTFGIDMDGNYAGNIFDPHNNPCLGDLPCQAISLDEHCMIIRRESGLRFDEDLEGFHIYGGDLCMQAWKKGMPNFVINAWLEHQSGGNIDAAFKESVKWFIDKWKNNGFIEKFKTTCFTCDLIKPSEERTSVNVIH
jgi:hypothetical protein